MADNKTPLMSEAGNPQANYDSLNYGTQQSHPITYVPVPVPVYHPNNAPTPRRPSPRRRFLRAIVFGFALWIGLSFAIPAFSGLLARHSDWFEKKRFHIPSGFSVVECGQDGALAMESSYPLASDKTTFTLPLDAHRFSFLSDGAFQHGEVEVKTSSSVENDIQVEVTATYTDKGFYNEARICRIEGHKGSTGVGIFTPRRWHWGRRHPRVRHDLHFSMIVSLPEKSKEDPLVIQNLELMFSNYMIDFGNLADLVKLDRVQVSTKNSHVKASSLRVDEAHISSSNGAISGHFNTSSNLVLHTSNSPISIEANLNYLEGARRPTSIDMVTSNSHVTSVVNLVAPCGEEGSQFQVLSKSSNGKVDCQVKEAPVKSIVHFVAVTSNAKIEADLPSTYEGSYKMTTSNADTNLEINDGVKDPAGKGRKRNVDEKSIGRGVAFGNVYWDTDGSKRGDVFIRSSNKDVVLRV